MFASFFSARIKEKQYESYTVKDGEDIDLKVKGSNYVMCPQQPSLSGDTCLLFCNGIN